MSEQQSAEGDSVSAPAAAPPAGSADPAAAVPEVAGGQDAPKIEAAPKADDSAEAVVGDDGPPSDAPKYDFSKMGDIASMLSAEPTGVGAKLVTAWGGAESPAFQENISYAAAARDRLQTKFPGITNILNMPLTAPDGTVVKLGNDPVVIALMAAIGRDSAGKPAARGNPVTSEAPAPRDQQAVKADIDRLLETTPVGSRGYTDKKFQAGLMRLYDELHGAGQIVGARQRTA